MLYYISKRLTSGRNFNKLNPLSIFRQDKKQSF